MPPGSGAMRQEPGVQGPAIFLQSQQLEDTGRLLHRICPTDRNGKKWNASVVRERIARCGRTLAQLWSDRATLVAQHPASSLDLPVDARQTVRPPKQYPRAIGRMPVFQGARFTNQWGHQQNIANNIDDSHLTLEEIPSGC